MSKQTIGILTHWSIPNYGAFLQAYAMRNALAQMYPDADVRQIAYMNKVHAKMYYALEIHEIYRYWPINPRFYFDVFKRLRRIKQIRQVGKFKQYYNEIPHTTEFNEKTISNAKVDYLVLGSDILWDYSVRFYNQDKPVFGYEIQSKHAISYAASFGTVKRENVHPEYVRKGINNLEHISVRDMNSKRICEDLTGKEVELVVDPTLLWDFQNDKNVIEPDLDYKYIAVYGSYFTEQQIAVIKAYCGENNLKIVYLDSVGDKCDWCDVFVDAATMTPFEWCGYVKKADIFVTCTFHGLMFGLIFNKRMLFHATNFMRDKAADFICYIGLEKNFLEENEFEKQLEYVWDYHLINTRVEERRVKSIDYIKRSIVE